MSDTVSIFYEAMDTEARFVQEEFGPRCNILSRI